MPTASGLSVAVKSTLIPGNVVGEHKVPGGLRPVDTLLAVLEVTEGVPPTKVDRTAEFSITAGKAGTIQNTTTNTTGKYLLVVWAKAN